MKIDKVEYSEVLSSPKPVVLDFFSVWCVPCRVVAPTIDYLHKTYGDKVNIWKVDADENEELTKRYNIRTVPTVLFIKSGKVIDKVTGGAVRSVYEDKIKQLIYEDRFS